MTTSYKIPANLTVPLTGMKVDTKKVLLWLFIVIVMYAFVTKGIPAIFNWIASGFKSGIDSMGGNQATPTYQTAALWNNKYLDSMGKNDPFGTGLYPQHATQSNLDYATLVKIARDVRSSFGTAFLGVKFTDGNESQFESAFSPCETQTDVSNVAVVYSELYNSSKMMYDAVRDPGTCVNIADDNDNGVISAVALQSFIQKVNKLPVY